MIGITNWRDHAKEAQRLLTLVVQTEDIAPGVAIADLYTAVIKIIEALNKLETRDDD